MSGICESWKRLPKHSNIFFFFCIDSQRMMLVGADHVGGGRSRGSGGGEASDRLQERQSEDKIPGKERSKAPALGNITW